MHTNAETKKKQCNACPSDSTCVAASVGAAVATTAVVGSALGEGDGALVAGAYVGSAGAAVVGDGNGVNGATVTTGASVGAWQTARTR